MSASAETDKGRGGVVEFRLAGACPPFPPFTLKAVNVIAWRFVSCVLVGFGRQRWESVTIGGEGPVHPFTIAIEETDHVSLIVKDQPVVGQVVVKGNFLDVLTEAIHGTLGAGLFQQCLK